MRYEQSGRTWCFCRRCWAPTMAMRAVLPTSLSHHTTNFWQTPSGRSLRTDATRCTTTVTMATRCCRSFRSCTLTTTTSPSTAPSSVACCTVCCSRPATLHPYTPCVCTWVLRESHRQKQLQNICTLLRTFNPQEPVVLAGDFNDWRGRAHSVLKREAGLQEVFVQSRGRAMRTFPAAAPVLALDRIYVRNAAVHKPLALPRMPWRQLSDHAPLAAEVVL